MSDQAMTDIQVAEKFGWTLDYIAGMPHYKWLDCVEYLELQKELGAISVDSY